MKETILLNNRYRIVETIGRGGFGETFLAIDTHMPSERQCVIKQLNPVVQPPQPWLQDRFQREASILEELGANSNQIPSLYAYFTEANKFYLVQEWVKGLNLQQLQEKSGQLTSVQVKEILLQLLPVLTYIHSHNIIHRDIKPENIILRQQDNRPVLIDFGAVKEAIINQGNYTQEQALSMAIGTPGYMASEQAAGRPVFSSDLYSLGMTAIYLLTGTKPQDLETDIHTGEVIWRQHLGEVHSNLITVLEKAVRFHPRDRFPTAQSMLEALTPPVVSSGSHTAILTPEYTSSESKPTHTGGTMVLDYPGLDHNSKLKDLMLPLLIGGGICLGVIGVTALAFVLMGPRNKPEVIVTPNTGSTETMETLPTFPIPSLEPHLTPETQAYLPTKPIPETTVEAVEPTPIVKPDPKPVEVAGGIPSFPLGSNQEQIRQKLGEPSNQADGFWSNTVVWTYPNLADGLEIKYVFDTRTQQLRQSEAIFTPDTSLELMQITLKQLLGNQKAPGMNSVLESVYQKETNLRSFNLKQIKGMIRRNSLGKINIIISASDFH